MTDDGGLVLGIIIGFVIGTPIFVYIGWLFANAETDDWER